MLKTQADPRGCIYKKAHTTPDTSLDNSMLFFCHVYHRNMLNLSRPDIGAKDKRRPHLLEGREHQKPFPIWPQSPAGSGWGWQPSSQMALVRLVRPQSGCCLCPRTGEHRDVFQALHHTGWQGWNTLLILHYSDPLPHQYIPEAHTKLAKQRLTFSSTIQSLPLQ